MDLRSLLKPPIDMRALSSHLDALAHPARRAACLSLSRAEQAALYDAAKGFRPITVDSFVPTDVADRTPVIHHGKNSLPLFTRFQKRFCRAGGSTESGARELWGYNHQWYSFFSGPGYFVAYDIADGQVLLDYTRLPPETIPIWPRILSNKSRLSRWIYNGTKDAMRGVSEHVTIGRAARAGVDMPNWFVLCREDVVRPALPASNTTA
jgi:hypothetical protein